MIKSHLIKVTNPKRNSMGKEKILGISMQLKDSKRECFEAKCPAQGSPGAASQQPHVLQRGSFAGHSWLG